MFDLTKFDEYKEDNRREVKRQKAAYLRRFGKPIRLLQIVMAE